MVAVQMVLLAAGCAALAWFYEPWWARWLLAWGGLDFLLVAAAYSVRWPGLFGKRANGRLSLLPSFVLLPYAALQSFTHYMQRLVSREDAYNAIRPNLLLGRRLTSVEQTELQITAVLDLTAEWTEPKPFRELDCLCIPILDKHAPTAAQLESGVEFMRARMLVGKVYVHCAQGHGRSATFAAAVLLAVGVSENVDAALKEVRRLRPGARPSRAQRAALGAYLSSR